MPLSVNEFIKKPKYFKPFLKKLETNDFLLEGDLGVFSFDLKDPTNIRLFELIKNMNVDAVELLIYDKDTKKYKNFKGSVNGKKGEAPFSKIHKSNVSGITLKGQKSDNKDDLAECGVVYYLDMFLNTKLTDIKFYTDAQVKNTRTKTPLDSVKIFLFENPDWDKACKDAAKCILNEIILKQNLRNYEFHHKTDIFNDLKKQGKQLTKLAEDKWNPGDFFLVKPTYKIKSYKTYQELNKEINAFDNIIPISLKKSAKEALGGSYALNNLSGNYGLPNFKSIKYKSFDDNFFKFFKECMVELKKHKNSDIIRVRTNNSNLAAIYGEIASNAKAANFFEGFPPSLAFIAMSSKYFNDIMFEVVCNCLSRSPLSSNFYKVSGNHLEVFDSLPSDFKIEYCAVSCDGNADIKWNVKIDGKLWKLQLRSKGSLPQFMLVPQPVSSSSQDKKIQAIKV